LEITAAKKAPATPQFVGQYLIPAPRQTVWEALNDPEVLKACLSGCEEMNKVSDDTFEATVTAKLGAVRARLKGRVVLSEIDPPNGYTISGSGQGGAVGFAKGGARVALADAEGGTLLTYEAQADLGGKLAAVGSRVIQGVAKKMADDFFGKFAERLGGGTPAAEAEPPAAAAQAPEASRPAAPVPAAAAAGLPDWMKCALANAAVSCIAVAVAVALAG